MIWTDIRALAQALGDCPPCRVVATSLGADPPHSGHLNCLREAAALGDLLVVILNGDDWLIRKKGFFLYPWAERAALLDDLYYVDHVVFWDEGPSVAGALEILRPSAFAKGGDRVLATMDLREMEVCRDLGIDLVFGVGGGKTNSSTELISRLVNDYGEVVWKKYRDSK